MPELEKKINTIFIGTPEFALPSLRALINDSDFKILAVITQPDKKVGRKQTITAPPIKIEAQKFNLQVMQPDKIITIAENISAMQPDIIIVVAYSQIIPEEILNIPKYGCINVHGSLLPKYRGAACIQAAIINGDEDTGITIMKMDKGLDTGPIFMQEKIKINDSDTTDTIYDKLSRLGGQLLPPIIKTYTHGGLYAEPQDDKLSSYSPRIQKNDGLIDWQKPAMVIERFIRAMTSWPGAWTLWEEKKIIIKKAHIIENNNPELSAGQVFIHESIPAIKCGENALLINKLQLEGKNETTGDAFLRGYQSFADSILRSDK